MSADLVIMAAGMGSRFGGCKQTAPIGPNGEMIIDYSVYDACKAGFSRAVIIIRKDIEKDFRQACGKRIEKMIDTHYVYQEKSSLPENYTLSPSREKPWGTGHAVLCAKDAVENSFLVINADDYYGKSIYKTMYDFLKKGDGLCMAGYRLGNTLSEHGYVSRGVCKVENGYLNDITEVREITIDTDIPKDTVVSMNMWGLDKKMFSYLEDGFCEFLKDNIDSPKNEYYLPSAIKARIAKTGEKLKVFTTEEKWYGVTYKEDAPAVRDAISGFIKEGLYD